MKVWFEDFKQIIDSQKVTQFWPNNTQTPEERVNAASRFVIYATCILYLIRRDVRIFVLGGMVLGVLYIMYKSNMIKDAALRPTSSSSEYSGCQKPSRDNPMANVLMSDYTENPSRDPACFFPSVRNGVAQFLDNTIRYDSGRSRSPLPKYQRNSMSRQFVTAPVSSIGGDQSGFAEWCYGGGNPMCKSHGGIYCDPNARGVQLEAFAGLDPSGDVRSSRLGHGIAA